MTDARTSFGAMRSALLQLKTAAASMEDSWENQEDMLNPKECAEMTYMIKEARAEINRIEVVSDAYGSMSSIRTKELTPA